MGGKSFTNQEPQIVIDAHMKVPWGGVKGGARFRCYLCGYKFKIGDYFRWIFAGKERVSNFITCEKCDGPDVLD